MRRLGICVLTIVVVLLCAAAWDWRAARREVQPVSTTASLSLAGPSFGSRNEAERFAAAIEAAGHPAYVRLRPEAGRYQVLVGPFVSTDEAESAQRAVARRGLAETRVIVDDSLRQAIRASRWAWARPDDQPQVAAASAPGMLTIVIETGSVPRAVSADRIDATLLDITVSPGHGAGASRWTAPEGTLLLRGMQVLPASTPDTVRLRLHVPREAVSRVRVEHRRTYVDLAWPDPPWPQAGRRPVQARVRQPQPAETTTPDSSAIHDAIARFRQVQPFLLSAVDAPDPQILAAVSGTLGEFPDTLPDEVRTAITMARDAASVGFVGDRRAYARRAISLFESAAAPHEAATSPQLPR